MQSFMQTEPNVRKSTDAYLDRGPVKALAVVKLIECILTVCGGAYVVVAALCGAEKLNIATALVAVFALAGFVLTLCDGIASFGTVQRRADKARMAAKVHSIKRVLYIIACALYVVSAVITAFAGRNMVMSLVLSLIPIAVVWVLAKYEARLRDLFNDIACELEGGRDVYHGTAPRGYFIALAIICGIALIGNFCGFSFYNSYTSSLGNISAYDMMSLSAVVSVTGLAKYMLAVKSCRIYGES